jgi:mannose-6-phosphate isomerase-like protein (cupin superfamily)/pyrroloquinoline quinone (PQQ) biosynthesis protein C
MLKESNTALDTSTAFFSDLASQHPIWHNPLLVLCQKGAFQLQDFQFIFSQYAHYNRSFTRLLATLMVQCENDHFRAELTHNLWEESGEQQHEKSHAHLFRVFLRDALLLSDDDLGTALPETKTFIHEYIQMCLNESPEGCAAILAFATEGIVSRLYSIFKSGLMQAGIAEKELHFFTLHIGCDDEHAAVIQTITQSYRHKANFQKNCETALLKALDLRDRYFKTLHDHLIQRPFKTWLADTHQAALTPDASKASVLSEQALQQADVLYRRQDKTKNIDFSVFRFPIQSTVLDPRLLTVHPQSCNEYHRHAHESWFYILSGSGLVTVEGKTHPVSAGDTVYVPRWVSHCTENNQDTPLVVLAVTDYYWTRRFPGNSESSYRG